MPTLSLADIEKLRNILSDRIKPLIPGDYALLDLPYHENLGDTMIWEGERCFLSTLPGKCVYASGKDTFNPKGKIKADTTILLHGGGNWGDLWPEHHEFRKQVIITHPHHRIVVMPQSVCYTSPEALKADVKFFSDYPDVIICVRDKESFRILSEALPNPIILVPDTAFFIDCARRDEERKPTGRTLYARRLDKEVNPHADVSGIPADAEVHDWPSIEFPSDELPRKLRRRLRWCRRLKRFTGIDRSKTVTDRFWANVARPRYVADAFAFVKDYDVVWSTRLHIAIAALLLGREVHVVDNSYRKTLNFLETWFHDRSWR